MGQVGRWGVLLLLVAAMGVQGCASGGRAGRLNRHQKKQDAFFLTQNHRVDAYYDHYSKTNTVPTVLERSKKHMRAILPEFKRQGLPFELAYLPMLESAFETRANSGVARGLWQFTQTTGREMGLRISRRTDERTNPRRSSRAAAIYLKTLARRFENDWALVLAAYNGGPGYIEQEMHRQGTRDFWRLKLRQETYEYVPRFLALVQVAKDMYPEKMHRY